MYFEIKSCDTSDAIWHLLTSNASYHIDKKREVFAYIAACLVIDFLTRLSKLYMNI